MKTLFLFLFLNVLIIYFFKNNVFAQNTQKYFISQEESDKTGKKTFFLKNDNGKTIKKFLQYTEIFPCEILKNRFVVMKINEKNNNEKTYGLINEKGKEVIPCEYEDYNNTFFLDQKNSLIRLGKWFLLKKQNKIGAIDANGKIILPFEYDNIEVLYNPGDDFPDEPRAILTQKNNIWDVLDLRTKQPKNLNFDAFLGYWETENYTFKQIAIFETQDNQTKQSKIVFFDFNTQQISEKINDNENHILSIILKKNNKFGVINRAGKVVVPFEYDEITPKQHDKYDIYKVKKEGKLQELGIKN